MTGRVTFRGGADLAKALQQLPRRVQTKFLNEALVHAAEPIRARMARLAPHEPGPPDLRTMMVISRMRGVDRQEAAVAIGPHKGGWYGSFQEFGTAHVAAQPFVRPAFDALREEALQRLAADLWVSLAGRGIARISAAADIVGGEV